MEMEMVTAKGKATGIEVIKRIVPIVKMGVNKVVLTEKIKMEELNWTLPLMV